MWEEVLGLLTYSSDVVVAYVSSEFSRNENDRSLFHEKSTQDNI